MITVFGLGFVGLTTALGFAHHGYRVYGVDVDEQKKDILKSGKVPFLEPHLEEELNNSFQQGLFSIEDNVKEALDKSEFIFYCVGTPYGVDGRADLSFLYQALDATVEKENNLLHKIIIIKSTIPPTTIEKNIVPYLEKKGVINGKDVDVVNNPEFLREGHCWEDFVHADRVVVGCANIDAAQRMEQLYAPFGVPFYNVSYNTAEFIKYLSNTLLATLISYSNEMALLADEIGGIDIAKAFHILHEDKRWKKGDMSSYFYPGCGYGGYCLPKDTNALYALAKGKDIETPILGDVIQMNNKLPEIIAERIIKKAESCGEIGILGLSFKPGSNDVRDCSSAKIIKELKEQGLKRIIAYDPVAMDEFEKVYKMNIEYAGSVDEIIRKADMLIILTAWDEFKTIRSKTDKMVLDYRYCLND